MDRKLDINIDYIKSNSSTNVKPPTYIRFKLFRLIYSRASDYI